MCLFDTTFRCDFETGDMCLFDIECGSDCTFEVGELCVIVRRESYHKGPGTIRPPKGKKIQLNDFGIERYQIVNEN